MRVRLVLSAFLALERNAAILAPLVRAGMLPVRAKVGLYRVIRPAHKKTAQPIRAMRSSLALGIYP